MINKDVLLVGGGLASAFVHQALRREGFEVVWVEDNAPTSASAFAAGLTNPIMGKRAAKTWNTEILLETRQKWLAQEVFFKTYFVEKPVFRPFKSIFEVNEWSAKSGESIFDCCKLTVHYENPEPTLWNAPWGGLEVGSAGYLKVNPFIEACQQNATVFKETLSYTDLILWDKHAEWKDFNFQYVIFCEGLNVKQNPWFATLPIIPVKGEVLTIETVQPLSSHYLLSAGIYMVPITDCTYAVGATYVPNEGDNTPTTAGKQELVQKLNEVLKVPYQIVNHQCGLRPGTPNRMAFIGQHPQHPYLYVINGLGSRGVFQAPFLADSLVNYWLHQTPFLPELDIKNIILK